MLGKLRVLMRTFGIEMTCERARKLSVYESQLLLTKTCEFSIGEMICWMPSENS